MGWDHGLSFCGDSVPMALLAPATVSRCDDCADCLFLCGKEKVLAQGGIVGEMAI